jgi:hypothetical protein
MGGQALEIQAGTRLWVQARSGIVLGMALDELRDLYPIDGDDKLKTTGIGVLEFNVTELVRAHLS